MHLPVQNLIQYPSLLPRDQQRLLSIMLNKPLFDDRMMLDDHKLYAFLSDHLDNL